MKRTLLLIVCSLVLSLAVQNTCPFGAAGKSSVVPKCGHCPLMRQCSSVAEGQVVLVPDTSPNHFPLFLFTTVKIDHAFQIDAIFGGAQLPALQYTEAYPAELLIPPKA